MISLLTFLSVASAQRGAPLLGHPTVYVLAAIVALLVTGLIACAREMRRQASDDRLNDLHIREQAARHDLVAFARTWAGRRRQ